MLMKSEILRITNIPQRSFDYFLRTGLIPYPDKIVWLNPPSSRDYFPDYVLHDFLHLKYLETSGIRALWELRRFTFGNGGIVKYEADIKKLCGDIFYEKVHSNEGEIAQKLCKLAEDSLPSQRIVGATFRAEKVGDEAFLILSRVVLKPKGGFFQVELKQSHSEENQKRLIEAYKVIMKGTLS